MNHPYWRDFLSLFAILTPPFAVAVAVTLGVHRRLGWSGPSGLAVYLGAAAVSLLIWSAILALFSRRRRAPSREDGPESP